MNELLEADTQPPAVPGHKINVQQGFPWQPGIQPISEGWIGLDAEARRADIPIRQVI